MTTEVTSKEFKRRVVNNLTRTLKIMWDFTGLSNNDMLKAKIPNYDGLRYRAEYGYITLPRLLDVTTACGLTLAILNDNGTIYPISRNNNEFSKTLKRYMTHAGTKASDIARKRGVSASEMSRLMNVTISFAPIFHILNVTGGKLILILSPEIYLEITEQDASSIPKYTDAIRAAS